MIKKLKKTLAVILSTAMLIGLLPMDVGAAGETILSGTCGENAVWTLDETTGVLTISGTGAMDDYETGGSPWNAERKKIQSIVVEDGITHIGNKAFSFVDRAKSAVLAESVISLGNYAFSDNSELVELYMPGVETIGERCFWGCRSLTSFEWPKKLHEIGSYAFYRCDKLTDPIFTENLKSIGEYAFVYCDSIKNVMIPASLTDIGYYVFDSCEGLRSVTFAEGASAMNGYMFRGCSALEEVVLPDGLKKIPEYAFADCVSLRWIWIPDTVTEIGHCAFEACSGLSRIAIPKSVKNIFRGAFFNCLNLQSAVYFGTEADWKKMTVGINNESLTNLSIEYDNHIYNRFEVSEKGSCMEPKVLSYIADDNSWRTEMIPAVGHRYENDICTVCGKEYTTNERLIAHGYCTPDIEWRLKTDGTLIISGQGAIPNYGARQFAPWYDYHDEIVQIIVGEGITYLGSKALAYCNYATTMILPDSMTEIGMEGCSDGYRMTDIKLPGKLKRIGNSAFFNCHSLTEIEFPETLEYIGTYAFQHCKALRELNLPASVRTIDSYAFQYCDGLTELVFPEGLEMLGNYSFEACKNLKSVHLPESLTYLGMYAFRGCSVLADINIPSQITAILQNTFEECDSLTKIELPKNIMRLDKAAFFSCDNLTDVYVFARNCKMDINVFARCAPNLTIYSAAGSLVEAYAVQNGLKFESIDTGDEEMTPIEPSIPVDPEEPEVPVEPTEPEEPENPVEKHQPVKIKAKQAGCTTAGNREYWYCGKCDKYFKDEACTRETTPEAETIYYPKTISLSTTHYTYTGAVRKPAVKVVGSNGKTISSSNYTVSYSSGRKYIGRYAVKVTFKGSYSGSKTMYFTIGPKNPTSVTTSLYGYDDVQVKWSRVSGASGYVIYYKKSTSSSYVKLGVAKSTATSYKKANLADGAQYTFKVVAYKKVGSYNCYNAGKTSSIYTLRRPYTPIVSRYGSKVKIRWSNIAGESGYQISQSTSKTGTKIVSTYATTSGNYRYVSAAKGKYYYYKVRAYRQVGSAKIYGPWSNVVRYRR